MFRHKNYYNEWFRRERGLEYGVHQNSSTVSRKTERMDNTVDGEMQMASVGRFTTRSENRFPFVSGRLCWYFTMSSRTLIVRYCNLRNLTHPSFFFSLTYHLVRQHSTFLQSQFSIFRPMANASHWKTLINERNNFVNFQLKTRCSFYGIQGAIFSII